MNKRCLTIACMWLAWPLVFPLPAKAEGKHKPIWLVITRPGLAKAIRPLAEHREKEGFQTVVSSESPAKAIAGLSSRPAYILLVGDDQPGQEKQPWYLPATRIQKYRWEPTQAVQFASDCVLGDLDGDLLLDVPVG